MAKQVKRLYKSSTDKRIFGVSGGLGEYFNIDPTIIRIIFIALFMFRSSGFWIYIVLGIILPYDFQVDKVQRPNVTKGKKTTKRSNLKDVTPKDEDIWDDF